VDVDRVARVIISGLEGGMLVSRIEKNDQALQDAMAQLDRYLETEIRAKRRRTKPVSERRRR
jgi:TetR/AcrR family transcriptional repressor of nem operon